MSLSRGDIYYVEAFPTSGSEQQSGRPAVIVSNDKNNEHSAVVEMVYLTTAPKTALPTHVTIRSAPRVSTVLCEQVHSIDVNRLTDFCGHCTEQELRAIDTALLISLGLTMGGGCSVQQPTEPEVPAPEAPSCDAAELIAVRAQLDLMRQMYDDLLQLKV